jgi:hypothetical protein
VSGRIPKAPEAYERKSENQFRRIVELLLQEAATSGGASRLADLKDVDLTGLADLDILRYDATAGRWKAGPAGGAGASRGMLSGAALLVRADQGISAADGDPIAQWDDQSGSGNHLLGSGTARPIYRAAAEDGEPLVEFDGSDDILTAALSAAYTGTGMTAYVLARVKGQGTLFSAGINGESDGSNNDKKWVFSVSSNGDIVPTHFGGGTIASVAIGGEMAYRRGLWVPLAFRLGYTTVGSQRVLTTWTPGGPLNKSVGTFNNLAVNRFRLGGGYANFGNPGDYVRCDVRVMAVYHTAHTDNQMAQNARALLAWPSILV